MRNPHIYWGAFILGWFEHLQDADLTGSDYKVLFLLCEKMHFTDNRSLLKQKEISQMLNMDKGNVSKCIKRLSNKQFIAKIPGGFMINPHLFYVGKSPRERFHFRGVFDDIIIENGENPIFNMDEERVVLEHNHPSKVDGRYDQNSFPF